MRRVDVLTSFFINAAERGPLTSPYVGPTDSLERAVSPLVFFKPYYVGLESYEYPVQMAHVLAGFSDIPSDFLENCVFPAYLDKNRHMAWMKDAATFFRNINGRGSRLQRYRVKGAVYYASNYAILDADLHILLLVTSTIAADKGMYTEFNKIYINPECMLSSNKGVVETFIRGNLYKAIQMFYYNGINAHVILKDVTTKFLCAPTVNIPSNRVDSIAYELLYGARHDLVQRL